MRFALYKNYSLLLLLFVVRNATDVVDVFQGNCAENTAKKYGIGREEQDEYAVRSYQLSQLAAREGVFDKEIVPVEIPKRKGQLGVITVWFVFLVFPLPVLGCQDSGFHSVAACSSHATK